MAQNKKTETRKKRSFVQLQAHRFPHTRMPEQSSRAGRATQDVVMIAYLLAFSALHRVYPTQLSSTQLWPLPYNARSLTLVCVLYK
ncbi:hypothetical protein BDW69DRAFT_39908 [Aspergillus filifer]